MLIMIYEVCILSLLYILDKKFNLPWFSRRLHVIGNRNVLRPDIILPFPLGLNFNKITHNIKFNYNNNYMILLAMIMAINKVFEIEDVAGITQPT